MFEALRGAIAEHALALWPGEGCGAVLGDGGAYLPVDGVPDVSRAGFRVDAGALGRLAERHGPLRALVHTRAVPAEGEYDTLASIPSAAEMRAQEALQVPFGVAVSDGARVVDRFWFGDQCPVEPLLGRPFRHGVSDCYTLIRDWHRREHGAVLPVFPRDWNWWLDGLDLYTEGFGKAGFRAVARDELAAGDTILFRMRSKVPNHGGVFLGDGWLVHHPGSVKPYDFMRVSHRVELERWERHATHWLRFDP